MELKLLVSTLRSGLEVAFLLAILSAYLVSSGRKSLLRPLRWAALLAIVAGPVLAYGVESGLDIEAIQGILNFAAAIATLTLTLWIAWGCLSRRGASNSWALACLAMAITIATVGLRGMDVSATFTKALVQTSGSFSPESSKLIAGVAGVLAAAIVGVLVYKALAQLKPRHLTLVLGLSLLILLVWEVTAVVQAMLIRGLIPLYDWLFNIIVPLINNYSAFHYLLFGITVLALVFASLQQWRHRPQLEGLNPAQKRKVRSTARHFRDTTAVALLSLALVLAINRGSAVYADRPLKLSPAKSVAALGDNIIIPVADVNDGKLHRFSFESGASGVRFLVIHKGSGVYGVALDACDFCGAAGYHQKGKDVICSKCGAAINTVTIGLPGGCNPIPLPHQVEGEELLIPVSGLDASAGLFH